MKKYYPEIILEKCSIHDFRFRKTGSFKVTYRDNSLFCDDQEILLNCSENRREFIIIGQEKLYYLQGFFGIDYKDNEKLYYMLYKLDGSNLLTDKRESIDIKNKIYSRSYLMFSKIGFFILKDKNNLSDFIQLPKITGSTGYREEVRISIGRNELYEDSLAGFIDRYQNNDIPEIVKVKINKDEMAAPENKKKSDRIEDYVSINGYEIILNYKIIDRK